MDAQSEKLEVFNKEFKNIKNNQREMKDTITEMKNTLEGISSRLNDTEEMNQWAGRPSSGNPCHWTDKRKKSEKKWGQFKKPLGQHQAQ